jgi:hypothetical protein
MMSRKTWESTKSLVGIAEHGLHNLRKYQSNIEKKAATAPINDVGPVGRSSYLHGV